MNNVFVCVYRHIEPDKRKLKEITTAALKTPLLNKFLEIYYDRNNFYDWGDDPSFFAAKNYLGDERFATWGVCRANVRRQLKKGDIVVFFCGKEKSKCWDYYFVGYGTVSHKEDDRIQVWKNDDYKHCRTYFNILIDKDAKHLEPFGGTHDDYDRRMKAGYVFFHSDTRLTSFNFSSPLHVASCNPLLSPIETWHVQDNRIKKLYTLLFETYTLQRKSLRSVHKQISHPHIKIENMQREELSEFRNTLFEISNTAQIFN